jgi:phosphatidylglycerol:prolipoprotein diacylglycerol transferase
MPWRPVLFSYGPLEIQSYTVCILTAVLLGGWLTYREAQRQGRLNENTLMAGAVGLLTGVIGAKTSMLIFLGPGDFWRLLPTIPAHGAAWTGALVGGYLGVALTERGLKVKECTGDLVAPFIPLSMAIGRLGNFLAGDAYGAPASLPWSIYQAGAYRHPVQLYELALDLILFGVLWLWRRRTTRNGQLFRMYVVGYAIIRFPMEFLRYQPTPQAFLGLTLVQWLCLAAVLGFGYQLFLNWRGVNCICALLPRPNIRRVET